MCIIAVTPIPYINRKASFGFEPDIAAKFLLVTVASQIVMVKENNENSGYNWRMVQVTLEQASVDWTRLLEEVAQGEEFVIVRGDAPFARLSPITPARQPGSAVGIITFVAEDFDAPLDEFTEYQ